MKPVMLAMVGVAFVASSAAAFAGADWTVIERARAQKQAQQRAEFQAKLQKLHAAQPGATSAAVH